MFFSVITKNLNWEILTKNLVMLDESTGKDNTDMIKISYSRTVVGRGFLAPLFYEDSLNCIPPPFFQIFSIPNHNLLCSFCCLVSLAEWMIVPQLMCYSI